jgi:DUF1009 family protein
VAKKVHPVAIPNPIQFDYTKSVGIVAGNGNFPLACLQSAKSKGMPVFVCAHKNETMDEVVNGADSFCWIKIGQVGKALKFFKKNNCTQVIFTGGISRLNVFKGVFPDWTGLKVIKRAGSLRDDAILRSAAEEFHKHGINIYASEVLLTEFVATKGCLTSRSLNDAEKSDALFGWKVAKAVGSFDVGQTVVVTDKVVTAVECVEGTDQAIIRAGGLTHSKTSVVVKVPKPHQDRRLDLPSIGIDTIRTMSKSRVTALVLEQGGAMILEPQLVINEANKLGISIEVWDPV